MPRSSFNQLGTEANWSRIPPVAYLTDSLASNLIFSGFFNVFTYLCTRYLRDPERGTDGHDKGCLMVGMPSLVGRRAGQSWLNEKLPQDYSLGSGTALSFSCLFSKMKDSHFLTNRVRTQRMHFLICIKGKLSQSARLALPPLFAQAVVGRYQWTPRCSSTLLWPS